MNEINMRATLFKSLSPSPLVSEWLVPVKIELRDKHLVWEEGMYNSISPPDNKKVLEPFLELYKASDEAILEFARHWGVLGLCKDGLPIAHTITSPPSSWRYENGCPALKKQGKSYESLERWRHYSRLFRTILSLSVVCGQSNYPTKATSLSENYVYISVPIGVMVKKLASGKKDYQFIIPDEMPGSREDWEFLLMEQGGNVSLGTDDKVMSGRLLIAEEINRLLYLVGIVPRFYWRYNEKGFVLKTRVVSTYLFPILIVQTMLAINGSPDYAICYRCKNPFFLRKGQHRGGKNYCKNCGAKASGLEAVKKYNLAERDNPDREKRKRLTQKERQAIIQKLRKPKPGLVKELAQKYGVTVTAIYKIGERARLRKA